MTFLKKLGQIIGKVTQVALGFGPIVSQFVPQSGGMVSVVTNDLQIVADIIVNVEAVGNALQLAGPDKLKAAAPLVAQAILKSSLLVNHKIADAGRFQVGAQKIADGMVDVLNSLHEDGAKAENKA